MNIFSVPQHQRVLVWSPYTRWTIAWTNGIEWWGDYNDPYDGEPGFTHWQPLPADPVVP